MTDLSKKSQQKMLWDTPNATFSLALEDGATLLDLQDGPTIDRCGQDHAHVNRSPSQASVRGRRTKGISGQHGIGSSGSVVLQSSLESKSQELLSSVGSMEYLQTWKRKVTPAGRWYMEHTAREDRRSVEGFSGWPRPTRQDALGRDRHNQRGGGIILSLLGVSRLHEGLTDESGALTPDHTAWLMGYPREWHLIARTAMRSFPKRRRCL